VAEVEETFIDADTREFDRSISKPISTSIGIQNKRLRVGWDERYLAKLLFEHRQPPSKRQASVSSNTGRP
jgi:hypothetical protein